VLKLSEGYRSKHKLRQEEPRSLLLKRRLLLTLNWKLKDKKNNRLSEGQRLRHKLLLKELLKKKL